MTLYDVFKPNKYGTVPMVRIHSKGSISKISDNLAKLSLLGEEDMLLDLDSIECILYRAHGNLVIKHPKLSCLSCYLYYLKPATPEEDLIVQVLDKDLPVFVKLDNGIIEVVLKDSKYIIRSEDSTAWFYSQQQGEYVPATLYYEDILYRLDLQQKLT